MAIFRNQTRTLDAMHLHTNSAMAQIRDGLMSKNRRISSQYFYDSRGSEIFRAITELPEYYLTSSELEILETHAEAIVVALCPGTSGVALLEAGPGDARKASRIAHALSKPGLRLHYGAVDISETAVNAAVSRIAGDFEIETAGLAGDYHDLLPRLARLWPDARKLILFFGSSIGNYASGAAVSLLRTMRRSIEPGDFALIGFDLKKEESILVPAYSDEQGLTREFNLNLLRRFNNELGGSFDLDRFDHRALYNRERGAMQSFLVSRCDQYVQVEQLGLNLSLQAGECIHTEDSHKYSVVDIEDLASASGFRVVEHFMDRAGYFTCSLWQAKNAVFGCSDGCAH